MKSKLLPYAGVTLLLIALGFVRSHAEMTQEIPINRVTSRMSISISTSAYTAILVAGQTQLPHRAGIKVNNPTTDTTAINCTIEVATFTAITAGTGEIEVGAGENPFIPTLNGNLFCIGLGTSAQTIYAREIGQ